jgi:hypothetical protein
LDERHGRGNRTHVTHLDWQNAPIEWRALAAISLISLATGIFREFGCGHPIESRAIRSTCHHHSVQETCRTSLGSKIPVNISLWQILGANLDEMEPARIPSDHEHEFSIELCVVLFRELFISW